MVRCVALRLHLKQPQGEIRSAVFLPDQPADLGPLSPFSVDGFKGDFVKMYYFHLFLLE
jgi:hypothetical protein